jgi:hypothetical protein
MDSKKVYLSKTFWFGVATALMPLIPGATEWLAANLQLVGLIWGGLTVLLRVITKDRVTLVE